MNKLWVCVRFVLVRIHVVRRKATFDPPRLKISFTPFSCPFHIVDTYFSKKSDKAARSLTGLKKLAPLSETNIYAGQPRTVP
jgi:hypothetical protein